MPFYRLHFMSPKNGGFERAVHFEAPDEDVALELACGHEGAHPLELWCDDRRIASIEANDPAARILSRRRKRPPAELPGGRRVR